MKKRVKLLEINFDVRLNFDFHVDTLTKEVSKKFHALKRVSNDMDSNKRRVKRFYKVPVLILSTRMDSSSIVGL